MKRLVVFLLAACTAFADETPTPMPPQQAPRAWLGLKVAKPDAGITAHLPSLPPGIGFVIRSIDADSPAATAGLREFDILWKIGDQMLVNEGQMAALLRLAKPGDEISLTAFRGGKPLEVTAKLTEAPQAILGLPDEWADAALLPGGSGGPMRVVNVSEKLATYSNDEGNVEVRRMGTVHHVKIINADDAILYDGEIASDADLEKIPMAWKNRVNALRRGLDHALDSRLMPIRQPRPRVVPPPQP